MLPAKLFSRNTLTKLESIGSDFEKTSKKLFSNSFLQTIGIFGVIAYLCFYYRQGGIKDQGLENPGVRDVGVYIEAGRAVLQGVNPYRILDIRFGTFGPVPFGIASYLIPDSFQTIFFQLINLGGIYLFILIFGRRHPNSNVLLVFFTVILTSATRELLVTNQITGILMGLIAIGYHLVDSAKYTSNRAIMVIPSFCFAVAIDLKPHLIFIFVFMLAISKGKYLLLLTTGTVWLVAHLIIDVSQRTFLELDWLNTLIRLSQAAESGELGDSVTFWPLVTHAFPGLSIPTLVMSLPFLLGVALLFKYAKKRDFEDLMGWILILPSISIYFHFYDLIPAMAFVLIRYSAIPSTLVLTPIAFFLISIEWSELRNQIMIISVLLIWKLKSGGEIKILKLLMSVIALGLLYILNSELATSPQMKQTLAVSECTIMVGLLLLHKKNAVLRIRSLK
jgi:hypothetical protein